MNHLLRRTKMKTTKTIFYVVMLILGYFYFVFLCYQSGALLGIEDPIIRFILANLVTYGWLAWINDALNFLRKSE